MNLFRNTSRIIFSIMLAAVLSVVSSFFMANESGTTQAPITFAGTGDNLSGWAWSGYTDVNGNKVGVGWISFNSKDCDADNNGYVDAGICEGNNDASTPTSNYGVNIGESNRFPGGYNNISGRAWSSNIGVVSFNPGEWGGCAPDGTCTNPQINWVAGGTGGTLSGWARALSGISGSGGWDGWISLSGSNYSLVLNSGGTFGTAPLVSSTDHYAWDGSYNDTNGNGIKDPSEPTATLGWIDWAPPGGGVVFTPLNPTPPAGSCGTAAGVMSATAPSTNLCSAGQTASSVTNSGTAPTVPNTWVWTCKYSGGATTQCSAPITQCADGFDNNGNGVADINDPACHTDKNKLNPGTYDPSIKSERTFNFKEF